MRVRDLINNYNNLLLFEADKNVNMFRDILSIVPQFTEEINDNINWANSVLVQKNRIIWYLKWVRLAYIEKAFRNMRDDAPIEYRRALTTLYNKYKDYQPPYSWYSDNFINILRQQLQHFLSLPIPQIQNFAFANQTPNDLFGNKGIFIKYEDRWKEKQAEIAQHLQPQEGDQILIDFKNGWAWWQLNRGSCSEEAKAMGHCGNVGGARSGDRILSLRKQSSHGWRPSLTFILEGDGYLGEMKGRGNDKPASQYHPYIVRLLELPLIKGIRGGGYLPQSNFKLSDLPEEEIKELAQFKPELADAITLYRLWGPTEQFGKRAIEETHQYSFTIPERWDDENKLFIMATYKDVDELVRDYGNELMQRAISGDLNLYYDYNMNEGELSNLYERLPLNLLRNIAIYAKNTYGEELNSEDDDMDQIDYSDSEEVFEMLYANDDDIIDRIKWAINDGMQSGTEVAAWKDAYNVLEDGFKGQYTYMEIKYTRSEKEEYKNKILLDSPCWIVCPPEKMVEILAEIENDDSIPAEYDEEPELKLEEPHYGWNDYDEKHAKERAIELIEEFLLGNKDK